jgi:hypothetical protein
MNRRNPGLYRKRMNKIADRTIFLSALVGLVWFAVSKSHSWHILIVGFAISLLAISLFTEVMSMRDPKVLSDKDISMLSPEDKMLVCEYIQINNEPITDKEFDKLKRTAVANNRIKMMVEQQKKACNK